jgi:hypothetical protein
MPELERTCPDCHRPLREIRLLTEPFKLGIAYTLAETKPNFWLGTLPIAGHVTPYLCEGCGRIALYGTPRGG